MISRPLLIEQRRKFGVLNSSPTESFIGLKIKLEKGIINISLGNCSKDETFRVYFYTRYLPDRRLFTRTEFRRPIQLPSTRTRLVSQTSRLVHGELFPRAVRSATFKRVPSNFHMFQCNCKRSRLIGSIQYLHGRARIYPNKSIEQTPRES